MCHNTKPNLVGKVVQMGLKIRGAGSSEQDARGRNNHNFEFTELDFAGYER